MLTPGSLDWSILKKYIYSEAMPCDFVLPELIQKGRDFIEQSAKTQMVYGVNTGFGRLANQSIAAEDIETLQVNLVRSHATGVGEPLKKSIVRLTMLLKYNSLAQGYSGIRAETLALLKKMIDLDLYPFIPEKGSVGACGDLAPLAHLTLTLLGEGQLFHQGEWRESAEVLKHHGLQAITLGAKEGLALLNGVQVSNAIALTALTEAENLFQWALTSGAMSTDAIKGSRAPFSDLIQKLKRSEGHAYVAEQLTALLEHSGINQSHADCDKVQDPYSFRCQPQVMGACYEQMQFVKNILVREANAVSDNPLIFAEEKQVLSGGNFHGQAIAMACDNLALAIAEIGSLSERRLAVMMDTQMSGLPLFLVNDPGLNSGFMMAQVTAAALVSENKALAMPRSVDTIPTSANQEDHVSMATNAALRLLQMVAHLRSVIAIELLAAAQGLDFLKPLQTSPKLDKAYQQIRAVVPFYDQDRYFAADIQAVENLILTQSLK